MFDSTLRVRFAPSPTGYLHIGGARTALFNYLLAKKYNGKFILRIEDTDQSRNSEEATQAIFESMAWLGLDYDETVFYQSQRLSIYYAYAEHLLSKGYAYKDGTCVRLNTEKVFETFNVEAFEDKIFGSILFNKSNIYDTVLIRENGYPTYNFACIIDDYEMDINFVLRGRDHLVNTAIQNLLSKCLDLPLPKFGFGHLPMIMANHKEKLSKRHGSVSVLEYKNNGYAADGLLSYLARFGWSNKDEEIWTKQELISLFSLEAMHCKDGVFDATKCKAINAKFIKTKLTQGDIVENIKLFSTQEENNIQASVPFVLNYPDFKQMAERLEFYNYVSEHKLQDPVLLQFIKNLSFSSQMEIKNDLQNFLKDLPNKVELYANLRLALTGSEKSLDISAILFLLGKEQSLKRLE